MSADQRKALADMLGPKSDARQRARDKFEKSRNQLEESLVKEMAETKGATRLATRIADLRTRIAESQGELEKLVATLREAHGKADADFTQAIDESEKALKRLGFDADEEGELSLHWNADELRRAIHEQIEKQIGTESDIDQKFDQAQTKVLAAETAEEAAQIVESLLYQ